MNPELIWVLLVLAGSMVLFATERLRMDMVALLALLALALPGVISVPQALAGFGDQTVIMIAGLFVVGGAIFRTGLADSLGRLLQSRAGGSITRALLLIMLATALLSAFLSSTGTVALMVPVVLGVARRSGLSPSLLLIPTAYAALLGGMLTLIATPPNLIVSGELEAAGLAPFSFFDFTGPGLIVLATGVLVTVLLAPRLLKERVPAADGPGAPGTAELWQHYGLTDRLVRTRVAADSVLAGMTVAEAGIRSRHKVRIIAVTSAGPRGPLTVPARPETVMRAGDILTLKGAADAVATVVSEYGLGSPEPTDLPEGVLLAEALVTPASALVGETVTSSRFRGRTGADVMGVIRGSERLPVAGDVRFQTGDALLLLGEPRVLSGLKQDTGTLVLVTESRELMDASFNRARAPWALGALVLMLVLMVTGLVPNVIAVLLAAAIVVLAGCLDMDQAYRDINWQTVVLLACLMPLATALGLTGGTDLLVGFMAGLLSGAGETVILAGVFLLTALLGVVISNTATAVLVAPVAVGLALQLGMDPRPVAMTVALASSAAFLTPVSSPVNMLVVSAGGYRFLDFMRLGLPLMLVTLISTLVAVRIFF